MRLTRRKNDIVYYKKDGVLLVPASMSGFDIRKTLQRLADLEDNLDSAQLTYKCDAKNQDELMCPHIDVLGRGNDLCCYRTVGGYCARMSQSKMQKVIDKLAKMEELYHESKSKENSESENRT